MAHQLIKLVSVLFLSFMVIPTIQGQGVSQNDREYWVNTLLKIADPVLSNLSKDQLKKNIPVGRGAMTAMLKLLFEQPGTFDKNGWLTIGVCGEQVELGDSYLSTPCVYLCSLGFLPLGLPADDIFWTAPLSPWTSVKAFSGEEFPIDKFMKP